MENKYKVIAVYKKPADEKKEAFDSHYNEVHRPITLKIPGLKEFRMNQVIGAPTGESHLYMIAEMVFEDKATWKAAMASKEMMESGKDAFKFAGELVSVHFAKEEVTQL
jgi:uncharacterized protein (TIGR02118 family)